MEARSGIDKLSCYPYLLHLLSPDLCEKLRQLNSTDLAQISVRLENRNIRWLYEHGLSVEIILAIPAEKTYFLNIPAVRRTLASEQLSITNIMCWTELEIVPGLKRKSIDPLLTDKAFPSGTLTNVTGDMNFVEVLINVRDEFITLISENLPKLPKVPITVDTFVWTVAAMLLTKVNGILDNPDEDRRLVEVQQLLGQIGDCDIIYVNWLLAAAQEDRERRLFHIILKLFFDNDFIDAHEVVITKIKTLTIYQAYGYTGLYQIWDIVNGHVLDAFSSCDISLKQYFGVAARFAELARTIVDTGQTLFVVMAVANLQNFLILCKNNLTNCGEVYDASKLAMRLRDKSGRLTLREVLLSTPEIIYLLRNMIFSGHPKSFKARSAFAYAVLEINDVGNPLLYEIYCQLYPQYAHELQFEYPPIGLTEQGSRGYRYILLGCRLITIDYARFNIGERRAILNYSLVTQVRYQFLHEDKSQFELTNLFFISYQSQPYFVKTQLLAFPNIFTPALKRTLANALISRTNQTMLWCALVIFLGNDEIIKDFGFLFQDNEFLIMLLKQMQVDTSNHLENPVLCVIAAQSYQLLLSLLSGIYTKIRSHPTFKMLLLAALRTKDNLLYVVATTRPDVLVDVIQAIGITDEENYAAVSSVLYGDKRIYDLLAEFSPEYLLLLLDLPYFQASMGKQQFATHFFKTTRLHTASPFICLLGSCPSAIYKLIDENLCMSHATEFVSTIYPEFSSQIKCICSLPSYRHLLPALFHIAACSHNQNLLLYLLREHGEKIDINVRDKQGNTLFMNFVKVGNYMPEIVKLFVYLKADLRLPAPNATSNQIGPELDWQEIISKEQICQLSRTLRSVSSRKHHLRVFYNGTQYTIKEIVENAMRVNRSYSQAWEKIQSIRKLDELNDSRSKLSQSA